MLTRRRFVFAGFVREGDAIELPRAGMVAQDDIHDFHTEEFISGNLAKYEPQSAQIVRAPPATKEQPAVEHA